jgi:hypothetical protein
LRETTAASPFSEETARTLSHEFGSSPSGGALRNRIANWDPEEPLVLSDDEHALVQQAADVAVTRNPPAAVYEELMRLRMLRDLPDG